jgi:hypothetical protein
MSDLKSSFARLRTMLKAPDISVPTHIREMCVEVEQIQRRLGTPVEQPNDPTRVRLLVHELNNFCTRLTLEQTL